MTTTTTRTCSSAPATATPPYTPPRWPSSRRSNPSKPEQPATAAAKQVGIPFLWEDLPGIPKKQTLHKRSTNSALPPPPARPAKNTDRRNHGSGVRRDPFLTALLECSKDGGDAARQGGGRVWKGLMGSLVYDMSCKRACGVSDSMVLLPGSARRRPFRYDLFNNAPSG